MAGERPRYGGELRRVVFAPIVTTDPVKAATPEEIEVVKNVHATLVTRGAGGAFVPALAEKVQLPTAAAPVLALTLREELVFHDGARLGAAEAKASLARLVTLRPELARLPGCAGLGAARVVSPLGLEIDALPGAAGTLLSVLADPVASIASARGDGEPVGAGPFRIAERAPTRIRLVPFLRHFAGRPYLNAITIEAITDPAESRRTLQSQSWDVIDLPAAADAPSQAGVLSSGEETALLHVNPAKPPAGMPALLAALDKADRQGMVDVILKGRGSVASSLLSETLLPVARPPRPAAAPAPTAATRLEIIYPANDADLSLAAERVKFELKGTLQIDPSPLPLDRFLERIARGEYACALQAAYFEPSSLAVQVARALGSDTPSSPAAASADDAKIVTGWLASIPARVYLFHRPRRILVREGLRDVMADGAPRYDDAWRDRTP
ncbi:MAG: ABC transporter substrate-binding protein [Acidobacteriota bacterium]